MRVLSRLVTAAGLVVAGGLALPGGAAQAAACSNTTGVTVVVDYGSTSSTYCAADASSAGAVLDSVTDVAYVPMYGQGVVCKINSVPSNQTCQRMPPGSAYWAFFHAPRGGSWTFSSVGVAEYNPAPGSVIGFAFGSGGAPSSAPPAAAPKPAPKPSTKPSPKPSPTPSSSSKPVASTPKPVGTTPARPGSSGTGGTAAGATGPGASTAAGPTATRAGVGSATTALPTATTTDGSPASPSSTDSTGAGADVAAARASSPDTGSPTTLLAGLGLVGLVGAGAAYLAVRRRATS